MLRVLQEAHARVPKRTFGSKKSFSPSVIFIAPLGLTTAVALVE